MRVLAVTSQKGGSGKTTIAGHIAVQAELAGCGPVALVDMDPQGSLSSWWNEREAERPFFAQTSVSRLADDVEEMRHVGIKLLVVDTPPAITSTIGLVIKLADLVVIPMRPSPHDLRAASATIDMVEQLGKASVFVINGAAPRARTTGDTAAALSQSGILAPTIVHQRADFATSMIDGRTVMEIPGSDRSSKEIVELWDFIGERLFPADAEGRPAGNGAGASPDLDIESRPRQTPEIV